MKRKNKAAVILLCIAVLLLCVLFLLMQKNSSSKNSKQPADKGSYSYYYVEPDAGVETTTEGDADIPFYAPQSVK